MRREFLKLMGLGGVAVALVACSGGDGVVWRQKLTVTVSTPSGEVSGSSVSEGFVKKLSGTERLGSGAVVGGRITRGEATVVDLGNGKYLFALLGPNDDTWYLPFYTLVPDFLNRFTNSEGRTYVEAAREFVQVKGARPVPRSRYPILVTFGNLNDPQSVKEVKPGNFAPVFGEGYALRSMSLEITDEKAVVDTVKSYLPWLSTLKTALIPTPLKPASQYKTVETLSAYNFCIGE